MASTPTLFLVYCILVLVLLGVVLGGRVFRVPRLQQTGAIGLIGVTVIWFYYVIIVESSNAPFIDDYNLLDTFHRMVYAPEWGDRMKALFEQVNQHRFAFERVLMYGIFRVTGSPAVHIQILAGNLFLLGILYQLYLVFRETDLHLFYFVPVALLLFSLLYYENAIWGIAAMQNTPLLFFLLLAARGISRESVPGDRMALVSAVVISFISGNGIAVWLVGAAVMVVQRRYRMLLLWLGAACAVLAFYFLFDYQFVASDRTNLFRYPVNNFIYLAGFMGSIFLGDYTHFEHRQYYPDMLLSVAGGLIMMGICGVWLLCTWYNRRSKKRRIYWLMTVVMLFLLGTGAMLVVSRPVEANILRGGEVFARRYVIFGTMFAVCVYLATLYLVRKRSVGRTVTMVAGITIGIAMNLGGYYLFLPKLFKQKATLELDTYYIQHHNYMLLSAGNRYGERLFWNHPSAFISIVQRLEETGIYRFGTTADSTFREDSLTNGRNWQTKVTFHQEAGFAPEKERLVTLEAAPAGTEKRKPVYFVLKSDHTTFILPALARLTPPGELVSRRAYLTPPYSYTFPRMKFPAGNYEIRIVVEGAAKQLEMINTGQLLPM